ncbi:MAG: CPBP family intramembrane metalloprotease [Puniceicoccales bacterium]|nr:CPBP family intramembrane metalloprotease [Puniceicoccales bacterium]
MFIQNFLWTTLPSPSLSQKLLPLKWLLSSIILSFIEEWLFRGLIFKILLKYMRPLLAIIFSSLLFAYFHFRPHYEISSHISYATFLDSFYYLYKVIFCTLANISYLNFLIIFAFGCLLAMIYFHTQNLSAPIGLHAGVVFTFMYLKIYISFPTSHHFFCSNNLLDSPFPLVVIIVAIIVFHLYYVCQKV